MTQIATQMSVTEAINTRCSVRSYTPEKVGQDAINGLLAAAVRAPTAIHEEPWVFLIVQDAAKLKRISERAKAFIVQEAVHARLHQGSHMLEAFSRPDFNVFYNAGTLIVICADKTGPFVAVRLLAGGGESDADRLFHGAGHLRHWFGCRGPQCAGHEGRTRDSGRSHRRLSHYCRRTRR